MAQVVDLARSRPRVQSQALWKPGMSSHTCNSSTWEVETGGSKVQGHFWLPNEFRTSLGYLRAYLKNKNNQT